MPNFKFLNLEYLFLLVYNLITKSHEAAIPASLVAFWEDVKVVSTFASLFLLTGIVYSTVRIYQIRKAEREELHTEPTLITSEEQKNTRWEQIVEHASSDNPNDWRQAIIECDIMLDEMATIMGYKGEGLGEKLKQIERSDFQTLDLAWEAHKVRNQIAHAGSNFMLTQRETRRVIDLYRQVFEEFKFI